tara:strand:- start:4621 stop:5529 length:909 start_codon:yes stop_codon:yes gene_type:complete
MIDISFEKNPELYKDYEECLKFLKEIKDENYEYPSEKVKFHIYSEIKNEKELLCVQSYLATQNLQKTELIIWSDYNIEDNELIQPYKDFITLKVYDPVVEAEDTLLENNPKLLLRDAKYYLQSDLARILLLHKYGGVWVDMDVVFLRDFKPILDQEYMYMWGSETDFERNGACATVLAMHKNSDFSHEMVRQLLITDPVYNSECWGKTMFAPLYKRYKYNVFPSSFFNIEWCINSKYKGKADHIEKQWFYEKLDNQDHLFLDSFSWHWHNSSKKGIPIVEGSKFDLLQKITIKKLEQRSFKV